MDLSKEYKQTKEVYKALGKKYLEDIKSLTPIEIKTFMDLLPREGRVLEVGCAGGRDTKVFVENGFNTTGIDLVEEFLDYAREYCPGAEFLKEDILSPKLEKNSFDGFWAHAVLVHFSDKDIELALSNIKDLLKEGGIVFASLKLGENEKVVTDALSQGKERYFNFVTEEQALDFFKKDFEIIYSKVLDDDAGRADVRWIRIMAKKK